VAGPKGKEYRVRVGDREYSARVVEAGPGRFKVLIEGREVEVVVERAGARAQAAGGSGGLHSSYSLSPPPAAERFLSGATAVEEKRPVAGTVVEAPVPGKVLKVLAKPGDRVGGKTVLFVLESMKMELEVYAPKEGVVKEVLVKPGDFVESGSKMAVIE